MTIRCADLEAVDFADTINSAADPIAHPRPGDFLREVMEDQRLAARALARDTELVSMVEPGGASKPSSVSITRVATPGGFEPPTDGLEIRCSIHLS